MKNDQPHEYRLYQMVSYEHKTHYVVHLSRSANNHPTYSLCPYNEDMDDKKNWLLNVLEEEIRF